MLYQRSFGIEDILWENMDNDASVQKLIKKADSEEKDSLGIL